MKITFIGGGNMATALIGGLIAQGRRAGDLHVVEISAPARARLKERFGVDGDEAVGELAAACDCVVLAVKPQQLREAAAALAPRLNRQVVLSIAAGVRIGDISRWLGGYSRIARAMPNTPALINAGISGLYAGPALAAGERETAAGVLSAVGQVVWVEREELLDAITAVSGSGPAYVFYFMEALEQAAVDLGIAPDSARALAAQTVLGAVRLAIESAEDPALLRARVTSKGGTTERAIATMEQAALKRHLIGAVRAAAERSHELGDELGRD